MNNKIFFFYLKVFALFLLAAMFSGCSKGVQNNELNYPAQIIEATIPSDTVDYPPQSKIGAALPEGNDIQHIRDYVKQENISPYPDSIQANEHTNSVGKVAEGVHLGKDNIGAMTGTELAAKLELIAAETDVAVVEAHYDTQTWAIMKEKTGKKLDVEKTVRAALAAAPNQKIKKVYTNIKPKVTSNKLEGNVILIAKFSTPLLDRSKSRVKNIHLAAKKIDRKIIMPGQEFSFNYTTGRRTKNAGYGKATTILKTPKGPKHVKAIGGGVCQLSTTIYNAALKCKLKITERHEHSDDVHYVPDGKDATVSYNWADLKFINNRNYPIMLRVYVGKRTVSVNILENRGLNMQ